MPNLRTRLGELVERWTLQANSPLAGAQGELAMRQCARDLDAALSAPDDVTDALRGLVEAVDNGDQFKIANACRKGRAALAAVERGRTGH